MIACSPRLHKYLNVTTIQNGVTNLNLVISILRYDLSHCAGFRPVPSDEPAGPVAGLAARQHPADHRGGDGAGAADSGHDRPESGRHVAPQRLLTPQPGQARLIYIFRVPTAQGKQGKWPKEFPVRENTGNLEILSKHREFCLNSGKTHGILLALVVNVLIHSKSKGYCDSCRKKMPNIC